jgi:hypothetical protein
MSKPNKNNTTVESRIGELVAIIIIVVGIVAIVCVYNQEEQVENTTMIEGECLTYLNEFKKSLKIEGECFTHIDEFKRISWPTSFCVEPKIGQRVESLSTPICSLRIQQITHCEKPSNIVGIANKPYLKIELR